MSAMEKTKVLHIVGALNLGGAETMIMNIFRNIDRSRFQFDFYLSGDSGGFYEEEVLQLGGRILNVGRRKKHPVKYCIELFKLIRKEKYDAIQIHATDAQDGLPAVVARLAGAKKVCLFSHNTSGQSMWRQKVMRVLFMWAVTEPQACSELAAQWMFGKHTGNAKVIPLPIDCELSAYDESVRLQERSKWKIKADEKVIGHIGRFQTQKNHTFLLDIFAEVLKLDQTYKLVLVGDGILRAEIDEKIDKLGLQNHVIQVGQISGASKLMSMFDLFLLPSLYEGFPTVLLEAQANGLPCVASSTITPTIAQTDLIRFLDLELPPEEWANCIVSLHERKNMAMYNQIIAEKYDIKKVSALFAEIYSER